MGISLAMVREWGAAENLRAFQARPRCLEFGSAAWCLLLLRRCGQGVGQASRCTADSLLINQQVAGVVQSEYQQGRNMAIAANCRDSFADRLAIAIAYHCAGGGGLFPGPVAPLHALFQLSLEMHARDDFLAQVTALF